MQSNTISPASTVPHTFAEHLRAQAVAELDDEGDGDPQPAYAVRLTGAMPLDEVIERLVGYGFSAGQQAYALEVFRDKAPALRVHKISRC